MKQAVCFLIFCLVCLPFVALQAQTDGTKYDTKVQEMNAIVTANPSYAQMMDIGVNDQGTRIYGLRIEASHYTLEEGKASYLLVAVHHGNEWNTADLSILFAKQLIDILKTPGSGQHSALVKGIFYVIPVLNITGYNANRRTETGKSGSTIDPNRDYPDVCVNNKYYQLASTQNLAYFCDRYNICGAVTAHGYVGTFTYPWGIYTTNYKTLDDGFYKSIATQSVKSNGYTIGTHSDIVYPASGSFEDWAYYKYGIWTTLLEVKSTSWDLNKDSACLLTYFSLLPAARSAKNQHTGTCTKTIDRGEEESRP